MALGVNTQLPDSRSQSWCCDVTTNVAIISEVVFYDIYDGDPLLQRRQLVLIVVCDLCVSDGFCLFHVFLLRPAAFKRSAASRFNLRQTHRKRPTDLGNKFSRSLFEPFILWDICICIRVGLKKKTDLK